MRQSIILFFLTIFVGFNLYSQSGVKETPKYLKTVEGIKEYSLSNGLQVLLIPDATQSNMIVNIVYHVGSRHEGYGESGMAHLLEHMMFKSTSKLGDIKKMLSDKGGNANGTTWYDRTNYFEIFPSTDENLKWSLEMEADRMINATMLQSDLDTEFSVVRNEFEIGENDAPGILQERILSTAYLWHNYGKSTIGSKEDIERVKADRLKVFYKKYYQPDNATLIIAGKFDESKALQYVSDYFSVIPRPDRVLEKTYTVEPAQDGERYVELKRAGDVYNIGATYHTAAYIDKDFAALDVLYEILQADPSGYMYKALVESQKASSLAIWQQNLHDPGFVYFKVEVPKDKDFATAKTAFLSQLDSISLRNYTNTDLERGKAKIMKQLENMVNNTIYFTIGLTEVIGAGGYQLGYMYRDNVANVTVDDLKNVANKYFKANNRTWGVFIPSAKEERVSPKEYSDEDISSITNDYKGKKIEQTTVTFDANIPNIKSHLTENKLPTGLRYSLLNKPIKGNKVIMNLQVPVASEKELENKSYIASLMAGMLKSGTKTMTKEQIQDKLDQTKTNLYFGWNNQKLIINISTYNDKLPEILSIVKSILTESTFPENELTKLKTENKASYESQMNDPQSIVFTLMSKRTDNYPKSSIFYTPDFKELIDGEQLVTRDQIVDFYKKYLGGSDAYGTIVGELKQVDVDKMMNNSFGDWKSKVKYTKAVPQFFATKENSETVNTPDKENGAVAAIINIKMNQTNPEYPALLMANEMLGGGGFMTARIPTRLREKEGISYGAGSFLNIPYDNEAGGLGVYAFFNPTKKSEVDTSIKDEISKMIKGGFTADELKTSITSWENGRNTTLGNDNFIANYITSKMENKVDISDFDQLAAKVKALNVNQINEVAKKYLTPDKMMMFYAGDFEKK